MPESTTATTPASGTVQAADVVMSENFLQSVMNSMASGEAKEHPTTPLPEVNVEKEPEQEKETEKEEVKEEEKETEQETTQETTPEKPEALEKRLKDSQAMIGRQANEVGELRKQVAELVKQQETLRKQTASPEALPYYEKLLRNTPEDIARATGKTVEEATNIQIAAQAAKDMMTDKLKEVDQLIQQNKQQQAFAQREADFMASHPEFEARKPAIQQFIKSAYPDGDIKGADPFVVAHLAYEYAGKVSATAQQSADKQNNKRIINARSQSTATSSVPSQTAKQKTLDPVDAEIKRVWDSSVAPSLQRA